MEGRTVRRGEGRSTVVRRATLPLILLTPGGPAPKSFVLVPASYVTVGSRVGSVGAFVEGVTGRSKRNWCLGRKKKKTKTGYFVDIVV